MKTSIFDWVSSATLLILLLGILGGTQSDKAFNLAPVAALLNAQINPHDVGTEPIDEVARRAGENIATTTKTAIATAANDQTDPRLAACRKGSVEAGEPIPRAKAMTAKQMNLGSLIEVQALLGEPHCNEQTRWGYAIEGNGMIWFSESEGGINAVIN